MVAIVEVLMAMVEVLVVVMAVVVVLALVVVSIMEVLLEVMLLVVVMVMLVELLRVVTCSVISVTAPVDIFRLCVVLLTVADTVSVGGGVMGIKVVATLVEAGGVSTDFLFVAFN